MSFRRGSAPEENKQSVPGIAWDKTQEKAQTHGRRQRFAPCAAAAAHVIDVIFFVDSSALDFGDGAAHRPAFHWYSTTIGFHSARVSRVSAAY